ncbi:MAG: hypothetical protein ACI81C_003762, partial [Alteromonas macleodii]
NAMVCSDWVDKQYVVGIDMFYVVWRNLTYVCVNFTKASNDIHGLSLTHNSKSDLHIGNVDA